MKKQNTIFAIGIPTINRADLLEPALERYVNDFPNTPIYIVDNGCQNLKLPEKSENIFIIANNQNAGVSGSWNQLCDVIFNGVFGFSLPCQNALILNDDIYLGRKSHEIHTFIEEKSFTLAVGPGTWYTFLLNHLVYQKTGPFDTNFFPAYFEDNDYAYRLLLLGFTHTVHQELAPEIFRNSQTIEKDQSLNNNFEKNRQYFIAKWGGEPQKETYLMPFNQPQ